MNAQFSSVMDKAALSMHLHVPSYELEALLHHGYEEVFCRKEKR